VGCGIDQEVLGASVIGVSRSESVIFASSGFKLTNCVKLQANLLAVTEIAGN
jgi:hypothetical protein